MDARNERLTEPFFQQTVERWRSTEPPPEEIFTEFDAVLQLEKISDRLRPDGFIFHSSRCGSTLVANACRCLDNSVVVSEAAAVDKLTARFITDVNDDGLKQTVYSVLLRGVVNALAQRRSGNERRFFVKFSCCSSAQLSRITRIWPEVPWLFLYRDPIETIVSNLRTKPDWMMDPDRRILATITATSVDMIEQMAPEELCARSIASFYSFARQLANEKCLLLNYNQLNVAAIVSVLSFFNIDPSSDELDAIQKTSRIYSKDLQATRSFVDDVDLKQQLASALVSEMAEKWAREPYLLLEQKRKQLS